MKAIRILLLSALLLPCGGALAMTTAPSSSNPIVAAPTAVTDSAAPWRLSWHGFINPHLYADSRQVVAGREDMMLFYPSPVQLDADGNDLGATPSLQLLSITARLGLTIQGPDVLGAHMRGYVEGDFTGSTNATINDLRLRHAYIDMQWQNGSLLMGQYWYPMTVHEVMPGTNPLNMGAPFHPYARYNQVRYTHRLGAWELVGVAAFELDNKSQGPDERFAVPTPVSSTAFATRSLVPELNVQLRYRGEHLFLGAAANLLTLRPRTYVMDTLGGKHRTTQRFFSPSFSLFARYQGAHWTLKGQTLLSDNLYEGCTLGGYIETMTLEGDRYSYAYRPWSYTTLWLDLGRTVGTWRPGLFVGYARNNCRLDSDGGLLAAYEQAYGRGFDIDRLYRIQPRLVYQAGHGLSLQGELEYTAAHYLVGTTEGDAEGTHWAANLRCSLSAVYAF